MSRVPQFLSQMRRQQYLKTAEKLRQRTTVQRETTKLVSLLLRAQSAGEGANRAMPASSVEGSAVKVEKNALRAKTKVRPESGTRSERRSRDPKESKMETNAGPSTKDKPEPRNRNEGRSRRVKESKVKSPANTKTKSGPESGTYSERRTGVKESKGSSPSTQLST
ncbi:hypothetical protein C8R44DRAFT_811729 [Mycena epipterygia]|nr:hypothetical protein C8R44DRAFT_811729 [Mycena epipterygia]